MDYSTLEKLAEFICGDDSSFAPVYRSGSELTRFFARAGLHTFTHDGSTRKWWTLNCLQNCSGKELNAVLKRLASPKEYQGDIKKLERALDSLNEILYVEELKIIIVNNEPKVAPRKIDIKIVENRVRELKPLPPPDFIGLKIETGLAKVLENRWREAELCVSNEAFTSAIIVMGSLLFIT